MYIRLTSATQLLLLYASLLVTLAQYNQIFILWPLVLPFWDQWDAEFDVISAQFHNNSLLAQLFLPHNEHFIFFHKVLVLLVYVFTGTWSVYIEKIGILVVSFGILSVVFRAIFKSSQLTFTELLAGFVISVYFAHPLHWENLLFGFQFQIYFHVLAVVICATLTPAIPRASQSIIVYILCIASFLSFASGVILFILYICIHTIDVFITFKRSTRKYWPCAMLILFACTGVASVLITPTIARHAAMRPSSLVALTTSLDRVLSFPLTQSFYLLPVFYVSLCLIGAYKRWFRENDHKIRIGWLLLTYSLGVACLICLGRGETASRYNLQLMFMPIGTLLIFLGFSGSYSRHVQRSRSTDLAVGWCGLLIGVAMVRLPIDSSQAASRWAAIVSAERAFLSHSYSQLDDATLRTLYPDPAKLRSILESTTFASIAPSVARPTPLQNSPTPSNANWIRKGYYPTTPNNDDAIGTYDIAGDGSVGCTVVYSGPLRTKYIKVTYSGYPNRMSRALYIRFANGLTQDFTHISNFGEAWTHTYLAVNDSTYTSIEIVACDDSTATWWAISGIQFSSFAEYKLDVVNDFVMQYNDKLIFILVFLTIVTLYRVASSPNSGSLMT